ncbi:MAG: Na/Pi cotransporter family protein, partial [Acidimicrobiia bacterium]|nr:Na/Pi cotransporter family protein [Acidimicrobiia bacterium]
MDGLAESLRLMAGGRLRRLLTRFTDNRVMGAITGAGTTAIIQSSSVTTVLVVGFVSAGVMTLSQAIGVILGANVGTTITAQIVAFKVTDYALGAVALGFFLQFVAKTPAKKARGQALLGLGLVFFGMSLMGDAMRPLREYEPFVDLMIAMENPIVGIAIGAGFTALVQSSSATTSIVIVLAAEGLIGLEAGIALVLGANVGTSVTALLAAIGKPRLALRAAYVHSLFNVLGVVLWLPFLGLLATWTSALSDDTAREIANAHTIFN